MRSISHEEDDARLASLGYKPELQRNFSPLAMLGLAFAILNVRNSKALQLKGRLNPMYG
ncbi:MAG: hypothetical protein LQ346_005777 [Caloplaca aetnensis]|nr:MAG: hypothetical protein LQ346_005777 [Caloplaca aetnensis]